MLGRILVVAPTHVGREVHMAHELFASAFAKRFLATEGFVLLRAMMWLIVDQRAHENMAGGNILPFIVVC